MENPQANSQDKENIDFNLIMVNRAKICREEIKQANDVIKK